MNDQVLCEEYIKHNPHISYSRVNNFLTKMGGIEAIKNKFIQTNKSQVSSNKKKKIKRKITPNWKLKFN